MWEFHKIYNLLRVQLQIKINWLDLEVKGQNITATGHYQIVLNDDRSTCVWTICPQSTQAGLAVGKKKTAWTFALHLLFYCLKFWWPFFFFSSFFSCHHLSCLTLTLHTAPPKIHPSVSWSGQKWRYGLEPTQEVLVCHTIPHHLTASSDHMNMKHWPPDSKFYALTIRQLSSVKLWQDSEQIEVHWPNCTREYKGPTPPRRLGSWFFLISCNHSVRAKATTRSIPSSLQTMSSCYTDSRDYGT